MGYAGYGNHAESPEKPGDPHEPLQREDGSGNLPRDQATPVVTRHEQGDEDPLRESRVAHARFARIDPGLTPPWHEISPHRRDGNPSVSPAATREISTPAEGAGPLPTEGNDVDPGLG
jgi:hypothetical protein